VQHGATGVDHGGVGGDLVVVFGAESGAEQACGEPAHGADGAAGADRAGPHDPRRVRGDDGAGTGREGARLRGVVTEVVSIRLGLTAPPSP
jgi:hypothetical protein